MTTKKFRLKLPSLGELFLLLFSILFAFLLCELVARYWLNNMASEADVKKFGLYEQVKPKAWRIQPHHYLNYITTPNYQRGELSHNSLGFRGAEIADPKPDSSYRIVAIGGSTTYTEFVRKNSKTYPFLLEQILREEYQHPNIEVINAGVPGYNSWESLMNLQFRVLDLEPDLILVYHGTNDVHTRLVRKSDYKGDNSAKRQQWQLPAISTWDKSAVLRIIRRKMGWSQQVWLQDVVSKQNYIPEYDRKKALEENPPIYYDRNLRSMVAIAQANGIDIMLATWANSPEFDDYSNTEAYQIGFKEHNEVIKGIGEDLNVPIFDFGQSMDTSKQYWHDGRHVNKDGALLKAQIFAQFIEEAFFQTKRTTKN